MTIRKRTYRVTGEMDAVVAQVGEKMARYEVVRSLARLGNCINKVYYGLYEMELRTAERTPELLISFTYQRTPNNKLSAFMNVVRQVQKWDGVHLDAEFVDEVIIQDD